MALTAARLTVAVARLSLAMTGALASTSGAVTLTLPDTLPRGSLRVTERIWPLS
ncbi:hypothetical protein D9M71_256100 [compost metagenome]